MRIYTYTAMLLLLLLAAGCSRDQAVISLDLPGGTRLLFQEGERAARALTQDRTEGYFEAITLTDLAIQLKKPVAEFTDRDQALAEYRQALRQEVRSFTLEEIAYLESVFLRVSRMIYRFSPQVLPSRIGLIKVNGYYLGQRAQFTRDEHIVLGEALLKPAAEETLVDALIRAIFHLYSREHAGQRSVLYKLIGYEPLPVLIDEITMPAPFRDKLLLQPDAQDRHYVTSVAGIDAPYLLPLHTSVFHHFTLETTSALHQTCSVYALEQTDSGTFALQVTTDGGSTLSDADLREAIRASDAGARPLFIHPEFVLAWQFSSAVRAGEEQANASTEYSKILDEISEQLQRTIQQIAVTNG